ncbi:MAG: hypothetical protein M1510_03500 [Nitrospirae bacterium]|nr:hypothetical protein [Nitrospirota bacterium]MCL5237444.1 hypothetical protein [Nitrospirota bacterium]
MAVFKKRYKFYEADNEGMFRAYPSLYETKKKKSKIKGIIKRIKEGVLGKQAQH